MRLLLVEDEADLALAVQKTLRAHSYVVDWAADGDIAWEYMQAESAYSLAILDWMLPGLSGIELCHKLRQNQHSFPILILSARDQMHDRVTGLDAGADDYLVKPFGMAELLARVRALLRRPGLVQTQILTVGNLTLNCQTYSISTPAHSAITLTAKEFQLLEYFMQHPGQVLSHEQIRARLWNFENESISNVVAAQIRLLRRKLEEVGQVEQIETIRGLGYRLNPDNV
ncbi:response regulator transcription factor [filamentous cyanobacterium LEGE 11480]|uniref:Response regulator transcription factor n=1 Tax=Romeriopsis navalis LEGE 11480 TaxID=2777977 RepID=A0A928Z3X3_9CYAN|nr:two-component system response regulator RppA [Romeriopsis navalis]MBE9030452.1 response regulator transcription factor [Romeriopsis navalis LEGE 11480]